MSLRSVRSASAFIFVLILVLTSLGLAQETVATISGTVTDSSGKPVANAKISAANKVSGQSAEAETDSDGHYAIPNLAPGDYEVTAADDGNNATGAVSVAAGAQQTLNLALAPNQAPSQSFPSAPSPQKSEPQSTEPSLSDLGFAPTEIKANPREQALLDKRTHMLKIHQRMGLITTIPMIATVITSLQAGGHKEDSATRDLHVALGSLTGDLYGITAYYAIRAPKIKGTETRGQIKFHKAMAWIHGPGMILTPILGAMAFSQKNNGEKVHGLAAAHGPVAIVTAGAFGAALLSVSLKF
ncbi:MAG TPA: carboxypeptidase-like regulatory domain-containing protein [Candidatus Sulfotelmatobacter sp.]|nr:carboxypeptidase-like regulatory domain-containing protein [Candidatus Sulfotelmatobacter sp.]